MSTQYTNTNKEHKASIRDVLFVFWKVIRNYKVSFFAIFIFAFTSSVLQAMVPLYFKKLFDLIGNAPLAEMHNVLLTILGIQFSVWIIYRIYSQLLNIMSSKVIVELKRYAYSYISEHSHSFFANNFTGSLVQKINRLSRGYDRITDRLIYTVIPLIVYIVTVCIVLYQIEKWYTVIVILWFIVYAGFNYWFSLFKLKYDLAVNEADSKTTGLLSDGITNHNAVQHFATHDYEKNVYTDATEDYRKKVLFIWNLRLYVDGFQVLGMMLMEFCILYYSLIMISTGEISIGTYVLIQTYFIALGSKMWDLTRIIRDFYEGFADGKEMVDLLLLPHDIQDSPEARVRGKELVIKTGEIVFDKVSFAFNETRDVIKDLSLTIVGGDKVALIGLSGAGKSTIVRLIMRLYDVASGSITIDGTNIAHVKQQSLRRMISFVPQEPVLFHRSLMENIRYGRLDATDEEVVEAAKRAYCHDFIVQLPQGYDTLVGERGIKLSGGERQRIAIARAFLKNAPILIFDEATSSLDSESEQHIQKALQVLMQNKTTIVIAHRLSTIREMNRIVVLENGTIVEDGNHAVLSTKKDGVYNKLWELQSGGFV